jgi:opacity protein-like surface antigen
MKHISAMALGTALLAPMAAQAGGPTTVVAEPVVAAPVVEVVTVTPDWTGWYGGAALGYADVSSSVDGLDGSGVIGGFFGGYRQDFGQFVGGVELDYDWTNTDLNDAGSATLDSVYRLKLQAGGDLGQTFLYGTAGWAWADATVAGQGLSDNGWFAGVGADYAINDRWLVGGEVLWHQFDDFDNTGIDIDATTFKVRAAYRF